MVSAPAQSPGGGSPLALAGAPSLAGAARFLDRTGDARVNAGDQLVLVFNMEVRVAEDPPSGLGLPVRSDTLGEGATWQSGPGPAEITLTLGTNANLSPRRAFRPDRLTSGAPSAIELLPSITSSSLRAVYSRIAPEPGPPVEVLPDFVHAQVLDAGEQVSAFALGDIDGDGQIDLLSALLGHGIHVYLAETPGNFPVLSAKLPARQVSALGLADLDHDGDLDLVAASLGAESTLWANDGRGFFEQRGGFPEVRAHDLVIGDLDRDGWLDVVFGCDGAEHTWFGREGLLLEPGQRFGATPTAALELADLDLDGDLDLLDVCQDPLSKTTHLSWRNDGQGRFEVWQRLGGSQAQGAAVGDLDLDGDPDLVIGDAFAVRIYLNDGQGRLLAGPPFNAVSAWPPALGDIDRDGRVDLVGMRGGAATWWRGEGKGRFSPAGGTIACDHVLKSRLFDLDQDGDLDLCLGTEEGLVLALGSAAVERQAISFQALTLPSASGALRGFDWNQVAGSAAPDLCSATDLGLLVRTDFAMQRSQELRAWPENAGAMVQQFLVQDFDGDAIPELLLATNAGISLTGLGAPGSRSQSSRSWPLGTIRSIGKGDFNADGWDDLGVGRQINSLPIVFLRTPRAGWEAVEVVRGEDEGGPATEGCLVRDFNRDGRAELLLGATAGQPTRMWRLTQDRRLELLASFEAGQCLGLDAADIDRDGDLDLLLTDASALAGSPSVRIWRQEYDSSFELAAAFAEGAASAAHLVDLDRDGRLELVVGFLDRPLELWRENDSHEWRRWTGFGEPPTRRLFVADCDLDGDLDILQIRDPHETPVLWRQND